MSSDQQPPWFRSALARRPRHGSLVVDGADVAYRSWDPEVPSTGATGVVLVHGSAAHGGWWDHVAPALASDRPVVALDLSGHGRSGRRETYSVDGWVAETEAVAAAVGLGTARVVIGHSMGAFVALRAAYSSLHDVRGVVAVDPPVRVVDRPARQARAAVVDRPLRVFGSREDAVARWHPAPRQDVLDYVRQHVAQSSVREVDGGWSWAFDPRSFDRPDIDPDDWTPIDQDVAILRATDGMLSAEMADRLVERLGPSAGWSEVDAGHHMMLDQPLALLAAMQTVLARIDARSRVPAHVRTTTEGAGA